jgi:hypothetical protein
MHKFFNFFKKDSIPFGLVLGFIAPLLGTYGYYLWKLKNAKGFFWTMKYLGWEENKLQSIFTISLMANAILFTIYVNSRIDKTARGIFILTLIYGVILLSLRIWYGQIR